MVKKLFGTIALSFLAVAVYSQSVSDIKQLVYHQRYKTAVARLHEMIKSQPGNTDAWYLLGQASIAEDSAIHFEDTLHAAPADVANDARIKSLLGHILLKKDSGVR